MAKVQLRAMRISACRDRDAHQVVVILESVMQGGDPLAVSIHQDIPLFSETRRLHELQRDMLNQNIKKFKKHFENLIKSNWHSSPFPFIMHLNL